MRIRSRIQKQAILDKKIEAGVMIPENFSRDMSLKNHPRQ